jgi:hypothetical protein
MSGLHRKKPKADYLDTFMKRARREAQPKDAKPQKDEAAN